MTEKKNVIEIAPYQPDTQDSVAAEALLETLRDRAERGEIVGVAVAYVCRDRAGGHALSPCQHGLTLLGTVQILQQRMTMEIGWGVNVEDIAPGDGGEAG